MVIYNIPVKFKPRKARRGCNEPRLLMAVTCVGAVVDDERLWSGELFNCFGRSATAIKAAQLHDDITCLSRGLKPALLLDYIRPDAHALQQFLHSLSRHNVALPYHELAILSINQNVF